MTPHIHVCVPANAPVEADDIPNTRLCSSACVCVHKETHTSMHANAQVEAEDILHGDWGSGAEGQPDARAQAALVATLRSLQSTKV